MFTSFNFDFFFILFACYLILTALVQFNFRRLTHFVVKVTNKYTKSLTTWIAFNIAIGVCTFAPWVIAALYDWQATLVTLVCGGVLDAVLMFVRRDDVVNYIAESLITKDAYTH